MSTNVKYTLAEKLSFQLIPETCPAIEKAIDKLVYHIDFGELSTVLAKYNVTPDKQILYAIDEYMSKKLFKAKIDLDKIIKYEAVFPLRLALVNEIEKELINNGRVHEPSNYEYWLKVKI